MALSSGGMFEVRKTGSDNNAGYFNPIASGAGTDYSQQDAPHVTIDGASVTATVHTDTWRLTISGASVSSSWVRNGLRITGGTATAGLYEITGVDIPNNRVSLDRSAGTAGQTATGAIGGALASPGRAAADVRYLYLYPNPVYFVHIKSGGGDYTVSTTSYDSNGRLMAYSATVIFVGYENTRWDFGTRPVIKASGISDSLMAGAETSEGRPFLLNLILDGDSLTNITGLGRGPGSSLAGFAQQCEFRNVRYGARNCRVIGCVFRNCSEMGVWNDGDYPTLAQYCEAIDCTTGFSGNTSQYANSNWENCIARNCTTGFVAAGTNMFHLTRNCTAVGCGTGFYTQRYGFWVNCVATHCTTYGFRIDHSSRQGTVLWNCAVFNNSTDISSSTANNRFEINTITLIEDPWVDRSAGDLRLNDAPGGGALLREAGIGFALQDAPIQIGAVHPLSTAGGLHVKRHMTGGFAA